MSKQITGIHVFEKREDNKWNEYSFAVQLLSILSWKKFHGRIVLYTNEEHLEDLRERGIDKYYDAIDTETLKRCPDMDKSKYWAFGKIYVASKQTEPFVLVDTDLWIDAPLNFNESLAVQGFHFESFDVNFPLNRYLDFDNSLPTKWIGRWRKDLMPLNCAILFLNNQRLIKEWYECALEIAQQPNQIEVDKAVSSYYMTFVEQRLLPMIAYEMGMPCGSITSLIYLTYATEFNGDEWYPHLKDITNDEYEIFSKIKHIWGIKSDIVNSEDVKNLVFQSVEASYNKYEESINHLKLLDPWKESSQILTNQ